MDNQEPTIAIRKELVNQDIHVWKNTLYVARVRHRAQKLVGATEARLAEYEKEVENALKMLDVYATILQELDDEERATKVAKERQAIEVLAQRNGHKEPATEQG